MAREQCGQVTALLHELQCGNHGAHGELFELVYDQLRKLASGLVRRERPGQTLQTTALVHELYIQFLKGRVFTQLTDRQHFFRIAVKAMRQLLMQQARRRRAQKRGGGRRCESLDQVLDNLEATCRAPYMDLDAALTKLEEVDPRGYSVVMLRFFVGLEIGEIATLLERSTKTVTRDWSHARAWLYGELSAGASDA